MAAKVVPIRDDIDPDRDAPEHFERGDQVELAEHTLAALGPAPVTFDAGMFWQYCASRGIWQKLEGSIVRNTAASFAGCPVGFGKTPQCLKLSRSAIIGAEAIARDRLESDARRLTFAEAAAGAAFRNGFVTVDNGEVIIREHRPENRCRHFYDFDYQRWAPESTPMLMEFLEELFADCSEDESAMRRDLLQEFSGACLLGDALRYQACLILYGEGGNGKSSLLTLLRAMFPRDALASIAPQRWSERFGLAGLEGKRANFVDETPSAEILDGGAFKAVVTGGEVTAERKHKDPFEFRPSCGHIFSTNWPITTTDHSAGFWRRPIILQFSRRFDLETAGDGSSVRRIAPERGVIENELGGVVAWAIEGAARAQRQGVYTMPDQSLRLLGEWRDGSDQIRLFLNDRAPGEVIPAAVFYTKYRDWAGDNGHRNPVSSRMFGLRVMATGLYDRTEGTTGRTYRRKVTPVPRTAE